LKDLELQVGRRHKATLTALEGKAMRRRCTPGRVALGIMLAYLLLAAGCGSYRNAQTYAEAVRLIRSGQYHEAVTKARALKLAGYPDAGVLYNYASALEEAARAPAEGEEAYGIAWLYLRKIPESYSGELAGEIRRFREELWPKAEKAIVAGTYSKWADKEARRMLQDIGEPGLAAREGPSAGPKKVRIELTSNKFQDETLMVSGVAENVGARPVYSPAVVLRVWDSSGKTLLREVRDWPEGMLEREMKPGARAPFELKASVPGIRAGIQYTIEVENVNTEVRYPR